MALAAGIMPDTFLDSPFSTIRHEAAYVIRHVMVFLVFGYIGLVLVVRLCLYLWRRLRGADQPPHWAGTAQGFPVTTVPTRPRAAN
jgi:hypothetical protein